MEVNKSKMRVKRAWTDTGKHFCYVEWRINDASFCFQQPSTDEDIMHSPEFSTGSPIGDKWVIQLTINDFRFEDRHFIELHKTNEFLKTRSKVNFHLKAFIIDDEFNKAESIDCYLNYWNRDYFDTAIELSTKELLEKKNKLLPNDTLTIGVELTVFGENSCIDDSVEFLPKRRRVIDDFKSLYQKEQDPDADIIVKVQDKIFKVHRTILIARCPDFLTLFTTEKDKNDKDCVVIPDMDPDVFKTILRFLYTDEFNYLDENVEDVFVTADKLNLHKLREMCQQSFYKILSCKNATRLLVMAIDYNLVELGDYISDFMVRNADQVIETPEYKAIVESNPSLGVILLKKLVTLNATSNSKNDKC